jgi:hypothetical protein
VYAVGSGEARTREDPSRYTTGTASGSDVSLPPHTARSGARERKALVLPMLSNLICVLEQRVLALLHRRRIPQSHLPYFNTFQGYSVELDSSADWTQVNNVIIAGSDENEY